MSRHTPRSMFRESSRTFSEESLDVPPVDVFIEEEDENGVKFLRRVTAGGKCYCLLLLLSNATCSWLVRKFLGEAFAVKRLQRAYAESKETKVQVCVLARQSSFRMYWSTRAWVSWLCLKISVLHVFCFSLTVSRPQVGKGSRMTRQIPLNAEPSEIIPAIAYR